MHIIVFSPPLKKQHMARIILYIAFFHLVICLGDHCEEAYRICLVRLHLHNTLWDVSWFIQTAHYCWTFGLSQSLAAVNSLVYVFFIIFWQCISKGVFFKGYCKGKMNIYFLELLQNSLSVALIHFVYTSALSESTGFFKASPRTVCCETSKYWPI